MSRFWDAFFSFNDLKHEHVSRQLMRPRIGGKPTGKVNVTLRRLLTGTGVDADEAIAASRMTAEALQRELTSDHPMTPQIEEAMSIVIMTAWLDGLGVGLQYGKGN